MGTPFPRHAKDGSLQASLRPFVLVLLSAGVCVAVFYTIDAYMSISVLSRHIALPRGLYYHSSWTLMIAKS